MSPVLEAGAWGLLSGFALVLGALVAWFVQLPPKVTAGVMAFGAGVLVSAIQVDLMDKAADEGGLVPAVVGFLGGSLVYTVASTVLARHGAQDRKRSGGRQPSEAEQAGSGTAIAVGAFLDGVPESVALGTSLLGGGGVSSVLVIAIFLSNLPEGLSSVAGMKAAGRSARYVFGVWGCIALVSGLAAAAGYGIFGSASPDLVAVMTAVAAGAILTMVADTMIPEAFAQARALTGLIAGVGFLLAFFVSRAGG